MSQSPSLTKALKAVERVLDADSGNLRELAEIAGVDAALLFLKADLTGVDLTKTDIELLLPLQTDFEGAKLTDQQRKKFRKENRSTNELRINKKVQDLRAQAVSEFLNWYSSQNRHYISVLGGEHLTTGFLRELLLEPLVEASSESDPVTPNYTNGVLVDIAPWVSNDNMPFLTRLFRLLGDLQAPLNTRSEEIVGQHYFLPIEDEVGKLIAELHPTEILDGFWLSLRGSANVLEAAKLLGNRRMVHAGAIEKNLVDLAWQTLLSLFETIPFECDADRAERFAAHLTKKKWPSLKTTKVLSAKVHPKVRTALFRQLLAQGNDDRIAELVKWLEDERGATGALSLENAFSQIQNFDVAIRLANQIGPRLASKQISVIERALFDTASNSEERARYNSFRKRFST